MPVLPPLQKFENTAFLLWKIEESTEELYRLTQLAENEREMCSMISHPKRKKEWLTARATLQHLLDQLKAPPATTLYKDLQGKPRLTGVNWYVSIAHCFPWVLVAIDQRYPLGVDLQRPSSQLVRVQKKFLQENEINYCRGELEKLCIYWCAKEAIYKAHPKGLLTLRNIDLHTAHHTLHGKANGLAFRVKYFWHQGHVITFARPFIK